jgi:hypothetical protein
MEQRRTIDKIAKEMTELYDVSREHALASVESLLRSLFAQGLVRARLVPDSEPGASLHD